MNERKKICLDCDGVLLDYWQANKDWAKIHHPEYKLSDKNYYMGLSQDEAWILIQSFWNSGNLSKLPYFSGALEGVNKLHEYYHIDVATALHPSYEDERLINLKDLKRHSFKCCKQNKVDYIINILKPDIAVEDKPKNVKALSNAGITVYYPKVKYTEGLEEYGIEYKDWDELTRVLLTEQGEDYLLKDIMEHQKDAWETLAKY